MNNPIETSKERATDQDIATALDNDWKTLRQCYDRLDEAPRWLRTHILALQELQALRASHEPPAPELPEELFDSHAVWLEAGNVQSRDVTRVLDAVVKLMKKRQSRPTKEVR